MKILVDTCIWSLALRRSQDASPDHVRQLQELIRKSRVQMIGPVRQELLSGIKSLQQFIRLKEHLAAFPDLPIRTPDYEKAAEFFNLCRSKGIQGSNTDFLICALAVHHEMPILTVDHDFLAFQKILPILLLDTE